MPGGNPYARMAALMRPESGGSGVKMRLGTVTQREPLEVVVAGIRLPKETLRVNCQLELDARDTVLLLTEDDQIFYILMKVVDAV